MLKEMGKVPDWNTELYLLNEGERNKPIFDLLSHVPVREPGRVLDIGCGPGNSTGMLKRAFPEAELIGIDNSPNMIAKAKETNADVTWLRRDANEDISDLGSFDIVFSNSVLHWMPDHQALLPRLFRSMGSNGAIAIQIPYFLGAMYEPISALAGSAKWDGLIPDKEPATFHDVGFYYDILAAHFSAFDVWTVKHTHVLGSKGDIMDFYRPTGFKGYFDQLGTDELRDAFLADIVPIIDSAYKPQSDGKYLLRVERLFFVAQRTD